MRTTAAAAPTTKSSLEVQERNIILDVYEFSPLNSLILLSRVV
jgi:hypothetical protein